MGSPYVIARVFSAYVKEVDEKPSPNPWGSKMPFGALMCEVNCSGWVHDVAFSPSGCRLAFVAHDSTVSLIDTNRSSQEAIVLRTAHLPFTAIQWVTENSLIAAGHDCSPMLFTYVGETLKFVTKLDVPSEQKSKNINSAMQMFRNIDRNAVSESVSVQLKTLHQNAITQIVPHSGRTDNLQKFTTCGIDGLVALWDLKTPLAAGLSQRFIYDGFRIELKWGLVPQKRERKIEDHSLPSSHGRTGVSSTILARGERF
ncbi:unnamed protein product [Toxocara canis]|uniref:Arp2/3 complex 41 kDa subunit n=1 Tax=Toxocara canis TaxID=6265 RepID=A0A183UNF9_TOXCA|nr:unnamed protein product [Toxocara canis]